MYQAVHKNITLNISVRAGLPNIAGNFDTRANAGEGYNGCIWSTANGLFITTEKGGRNVSAFANGVGSATNTDRTNFNASKSNSLYGRSTTVTPLSRSTMYYIKY